MLYQQVVDRVDSPRQKCKVASLGVQASAKAAKVYGIFIFQRNNYFVLVTEIIKFLPKSCKFKIQITFCCHQSGFTKNKYSNAVKKV